MIKIPDPGNWDMIVFDVDGTLLDREGFHEDLVKLARRVDREIMPVSLASGRTLPNVTPIMQAIGCLLYTSPSPRDQRGSRMPSSA